MRMATVGFVGLGHMGSPMARNLVKAGHSLQVFDLNEEAMNIAVQFGAKRCASLQEAAKGVAFVVTMVPTGKETRAVYLGPQGIIANASPGTILLDCSTIDVDSARAVGEAAKAAGFQMLDAPVSGGVMGAENATLTFMCGGEAKTFETAKAVLGGMGKKLVHCGASGLGQAAKICNNMLAGICAAATAEAMVLGKNLGVDPKVLYDVITTSSGANFVLQTNCPIPGVVATAAVNRDFKPGFKAALMLKDMRLSQDAARMTGTPTAIGAVATQMYAMLERAGHAELDSSSIVKLVTGDI
jgi:3-hydroxyisobutyrate dehydrogenase